MVKSVILDASTLIAIWDNYPKELLVFDSIWEFLEELIEEEKIYVTSVNFEEVKHKSKEAYDYYNSLNIKVIKPNQEILSNALQIQRILGLDDSEIKNKLRKGVDEGDIICIATAQVHDLVLITEEVRQIVPPGNLANYKIPKVCDMSSVNVECINFLDFLKQMNGYTKVGAK